MSQEVFDHIYKVPCAQPGDLISFLPACPPPSSKQMPGSDLCCPRTRMGGSSGDLSVTLRGLKGSPTGEEVLEQALQLRPPGGQPPVGWHGCREQGCRWTELYLPKVAGNPSFFAQGERPKGAPRTSALAFFPAAQRAVPTPPVLSS